MSSIKIPKGQIAWERYVKEGKLYYIVTSNILRTNYYLYKVENDNTLKKIKTNNTPFFTNETKKLWG